MTDTTKTQTPRGTPGGAYTRTPSDGHGHAPPRSRIPSPATLISGLASDVSTLLRKEIALARAEMTEKVDQVRSGVVELSTGALVAYAGGMFLLLAATAGLATVMPMWAAALIVGGVVTAIGLALLASGRNNLRTGNLKPSRTLSSLRDDAQLARDEARRARG